MPLFCGRSGDGLLVNPLCPTPDPNSRIFASCSSSWLMMVQPAAARGSIVLRENSIRRGPSRRC